MTAAAPPTGRPASSATTLAMCTLLGLVGALLTIRTVAEPDAGWLIATGERVLHGDFPFHDTWSWTDPHATYIAHEWGAATGMAMSVRVFGFVGGLQVWQGLTLTVAFGLQAWNARVWSRRSWVFAALSVLALLVLGLEIWSPRGQLASVPFLVAEAWWFQRALAGDVRRVPWWQLVALQALWVNLHGMSVLGIALPFGFALAGLAAGFVPARYRGNEQAMTWEVSAQRADARVRHPRAHLPVRPASTLDVTDHLRRAGWRVVGQLITPYGLAGALHAVVVITKSSSAISEYQSPNFKEVFPLVAAVVSIALVALLALDRRPTAALTVFGLFLLALTSQRYLLIVAAVVVPLASPLLKDEWLVVPRAWVPRAVLVAASLIAVANVAGTPGLRTVDRTFLPVGPAAWLAANPVQDRPLFAPYAAGGYLIHAATHGEKVAWDGRNDMYPTTLLPELAAVQAARPGWDSVLDPTAGITVIEPLGSTLDDRLGHDQRWTLAYRDKDWVVFVPAVPVTHYPGPLQPLPLEPSTQP